MLFLLLTVLMTISSSGFVLFTASKAAKQDLHRSIGGYFMIQTGMDGIDKTDDKLLREIQKLDHVARYNGMDTYYLFTEGLKLVQGSHFGTGNVEEFMPKFIGCIDSSLHERFWTSSLQLQEGRHIVPEDIHKVILSEQVAEQNGLTIGDIITASVVEGVRDWRENAYGTQVSLEIVGIYSPLRKEAKHPTTPESEIQENILFTDIHTAKELFLIRFPNRAQADYIYSSGLMFFLDDPACMEETISLLKQQPYADWNHLIISQNSELYEQAAGSIQKIQTLSLFLMGTILILGIGVLTLVLYMWTRERTAEIAVLLSLGFSKWEIYIQLLIESYIVTIPAAGVSVLLSTFAVKQLGERMGDILNHFRLGVLEISILLISVISIILISVLLSCISIMRKQPRDILTDLS